MDKINEIMERLPSTLQTLQQQDTNDNKVSIYGKGKVTALVFEAGVIRLKKAFPKLPDGWYDILDEAIDQDGFTDQRFKDAVWNLIKTCPYPEPTIANILGFDRNVVMYNIKELMKKYADSYYPGAKYDPIASEYKLINLNGDMRLIKKEDFNPVRFKEWEVRNR